MSLQQFNVIRSPATEQHRKQLDIDALVGALSPDAELVWLISGRMIFRGGYCGDDDQLDSACARLWGRLRKYPPMVC